MPRGALALPVPPVESDRLVAPEVRAAAVPRVLVEWRARRGSQVPPVLRAGLVLRAALGHREQLELPGLREEPVPVVTPEHQDPMELQDLQGPPVPRDLPVPLEQQVRRVSTVLLDLRVAPVLAVLLAVRALPERAAVRELPGVRAPVVRLGIPERQVFPERRDLRV